MGLQNTARHRAMVSARAIRRSRRASGAALVPARKVAAIQVFVTKLDQFLGTELFAADQPVIIGRHREAQLRLAVDNVSREHLRLTLEDGVVLAEDLGSANGTLLNRKRLVGKSEVKASDTLQIGPYTLRLRALMPQIDRAASAISEADTKVDAVLSTHGSQGTEDESIDVASAIDWRIYEEAIRRATGTEPAKNVIHLKRTDTVTRVREPMDDEDSATEARLTSREATGPAFLALLRSVTTHGTPEPAVDLSVGKRLAELEKMVERMSSTEGSQSELTKPERRVSAVRPISEDDLMWSDADEIIEGSSAFSDAFAIVPQESMLAVEADAQETSTEPRREREASTARERSSVSLPVKPETTAATDVEDRPASALRRYDSIPMSSEAIARSLAAPAGNHQREPRRISANLVTPPRLELPPIPVIPGRPATVLSRSGPLPAAPRPATVAAKPTPPPPAPVAARPTPPPPPAPIVRRVASVIISDETLKNGGAELSGLKPIPRAKLSSAPPPPAAPAPRPVTRALSGPSISVSPSPSRGVPVVSRSPAPQLKRKSSIPPPPVVGPQRPSALPAPWVGQKPSTQPPKPPAAKSLPPPPPPPSERAGSLPEVARNTRPAPVVSAQKPIALAIPPGGTGPRVTLSPPEAQRGSGRVKVSAVSLAPRTTIAPNESSLTEPLAAADLLFDGVEITARHGEKLLDIAQLRHEGDQYVLGHATPQGARAPASAHTGLRLLKIDADRNVDLVFPREVAGQLVRNGETITLHELTENRKYSCLRLKARDVVTVLLGKGPTAVSYHIRFTRAPRSISVSRERAASRA